MSEEKLGSKLATDESKFSFAINYYQHGIKSRDWNMNQKYGKRILSCKVLARINLKIQSVLHLLIWVPFMQNMDFFQWPSQCGKKLTTHVVLRMIKEDFV